MLRPDANGGKERGTNNYSGKGVDFYTYFESVGKSMRNTGAEPLERGAQYVFFFFRAYFQKCHRRQGLYMYFHFFFNVYECHRRQHTDTTSKY